MIGMVSGDDRLSSSSGAPLNQPDFELTVKAAEDMIVGELSLSLLLSSEASRVSVGNFQRTKYE